MIWLWSVVLLSYMSLGTAYYHELSNKTFNVTKGQNIYFGYSIAYESTKKLLITSAPLSNYTGDIYVCDIGNTTCSVMGTNTSYMDSQYNEEFQQNMWLGAVIKAAPTYFVTCAPLVITKSQYIPTFIGTYGQCFYGDVNDLSKLNKLKPVTYTKKPNGYWILEQTTDSFGWSIDIVNKSNKSFIVGSPAMMQGRVEQYDGFGDAPKTVTGNSYDLKFNFGYGVANGHFIYDNDVTYAIGSTYGNGKVIFTDTKFKRLYDLIKGTDEKVIGSMYGAVLCTASLTGHQKDLLVAAPTYASRNRLNQGAVYVYTRNNMNIQEFRRKIVGDNDNSYFGSAIVNVGDLNKDNKDEIAIGAPYEYKGRGTVYLYSGADILQADKLLPLQTITPQENGWLTFGLSLSALDDYDDNGCNELAIGAPASDKIMVLRCMASVFVEVKPKVNQAKIQNWRKNNEVRNATHFVFEACLKVTYPDKPKDVKATIRMKVEVRHENVKLANPKEAEFNIYLNTKLQEYCKTIPVYAPEKGNYNDPIEIIINAKHIDDPIHSIDFTSSQIRLSDQSITHSRSFVWATECNNNICSPNLQHISTKLSTTGKYTIGSTDTITASILIKNTGDPAYDACLLVNVDGARFLQATDSCALVKGGNLQCTPKELLRNGSQWNTDNITIETKHLTSKDQRVVITGTLYNHCLEKKSSTFVETIALTRDYDGVFVSGVTNTGIDDFVNMTTTDITIGKVFEHIYKIINHGKTTWKDLKFTLKVQKLNFIHIEPVSHQIVGVNCTELEMEKEKLITCDVAELSKNMITVSVPIRVLPNSVGNLIEKQNLTIYSMMTLDLNIYEKHAKVTSTLRLQEVTVPLWLYISTGIVGLLILVVIFFILRELGCLRRKNKDRLKRVRQSVRRQTMMRERSRSQTSQSSNIRHERLNEMSNEEVQAALADAAKKKYDRRVQVTD